MPATASVTCRVRMTTPATDDLLPSSDGHIFHVGFGFILGRYPNDKSDRIPRLLNFTNGSPCLKRSHLSQD